MYLYYKYYNMFQAYLMYFPRSKTNHFSKISLPNLLNNDIRNQDTCVATVTCCYWTLLLIGPLQLTEQGLYICILTNIINFYL